MELQDIVHTYNPFASQFLKVSSMIATGVPNISLNLKSTPKNRAYSIILDGTYDVSKKECIALLVRYIEDDLHPHPVERIIHVFTTSETTGENIKKHVFSKFNDLGLPLDYLVEQSMDGAGNMRGVYKGMQALILKEALKAIYIWCHAHRLNLVVAHISIFTPAGIMDNEKIEGWQISEICHTYQLDVQNIVDEYNDFRSLYLESQSIIFCEDHDALYIDESIANDQITKENINSEIMTKIKKWIKFSFILPYRLLNQLNSYSNLNLLYKYLLTLITSFSAE
ncbi:uncharacterized protein LOC135925732 [Gordionus sp. m RMFG-2023]|uniref:uncharacterized protein LOC135925732 n=1 Tax=Gordionus sp. m RMFG-2023 TaxID=3053472 RepID=UPI0031FBE065